MRKLLFYRQIIEVDHKLMLILDGEYGCFQNVVCLSTGEVARRGRVFRILITVSFARIDPSKHHHFMHAGSIWKRTFIYHKSQS